IISNLKENTTIGWVFTDTAQEAINGVYSGDYYAALVIDEQFSANMISFLSGEIENPVITYYENEKKNAIAPKITSKVKTTIEREVDHAFVSTVAESLLKGGEYFATLDEEGNITGQGIEKLEQLDSDLNGLIALLDSYIALMDSTESISTAGEAITDSADSITKLAEEMANEAQSAGSDAKQDVQKAKDKVDAKIETLNGQLDVMGASVNDITNMMMGVTFGGNIDTSSIQAKVDQLQAAWGTKEDGTGYYYMLTHMSNLSDEQSQAISAKADELDTRIQGLDADVTNLSVAAVQSEENLNKAKEVFAQDLALCISDTQYVRSQYDTVVSPLGQSAIDSTSKSVDEIEKLLNYNAESIDLVKDNLSNYAVIMEQGKDSLVKSRDEAVAMEAELAAMIAQIKSIGQNEAYLKIMELLQNDPDLLSDFISSPVEIADEYIYPVENNGSMTAPFYIVLSIWVGALIMSTILKTTVKDTTGMHNLKNWQCFLGRFFTTFVIGQIQTIITVMGAFLFVGIQCKHPVYFWFAAAWTSLIYSLLLYAFAYSFGNVGEALSVILMVIQVAGAGGTFPIEVLPKVFQILYKFMPFNYSMNALRECIAGFYGDTYRNCMLTLIAYGVFAVFIGVVLYHPFKILNEKIEKSKEKSGILI
ncbi:MAG: YhgE/Pip domain-containing protein, partial [Pseudobutyrivibrio sp.]|nr:YhgE/Pip domain-containing protein [Pseudobutyrivibrio sp.]